MSAKNNRPPLHLIVAVPVVLIIIGAFAMAGMAVLENIRFVNATNQIVRIISEMREAAGQQKTFAQTPGEDIWADLAAVGRMQDAAHFNPWRGAIRGVTAGPAAMRIESDLPVHDCRRMALYFLGRQPVELGLLQVEAQSLGDNRWVQIYPLPPAVYAAAAETACGQTPYARLAMVFRIR